MLAVEAEDVNICDDSLELYLFVMNSGRYNFQDAELAANLA